MYKIIPIRKHGLEQYIVVERIGDKNVVVYTCWSEAGAHTWVYRKSYELKIDQYKKAN